jgi:hypothetical protein
MSQKIDAQGRLLGAWGLDELEVVTTSTRKTALTRRQAHRLWYRLIWEITEMQAKIHVQPIFPNPNRLPLIAQLARQHYLDPSERPMKAESRSRDLDRDIDISNANKDDEDESDDTSEDEGRRILAEGRQALEEGRRLLEDDNRITKHHESLSDICEPEGLQLVEDLAREHRQQAPGESTNMHPRNYLRTLQRKRLRKSPNGSQVQESLSTSRSGSSELPQATLNSTEREPFAHSSTSSRSQAIPRRLLSSKSDKKDGRRRGGK